MRSLEDTFHANVETKEAECVQLKSHRSGKATSNERLWGIFIPDEALMHSVSSLAEDRKKRKKQKEKKEK